MRDVHGDVFDALEARAERAGWAAGTGGSWAAYDVAQAALEAFTGGNDPVDAMRQTVAAFPERDARRQARAMRYAVEQDIRQACAA